MTMISKIVTRKRDGVVESEVVPHVESLSRAAQDVLTKVRVLRDYTETTGFKTTRSQNDLIQSLNGDDLASVLLILRNNTKVPLPGFSATVRRIDEMADANGRTLAELKR